MHSCGKVVTVVAAMRLIERGLMNLDDLVYKYLPIIENAFIINANKEKQFVGKTMTIRHLFSMTAGFTYDMGTEPILRLAKESNGKATLIDFIQKFVETPLSFEPGSRFQYSLCHDMLAAVVEVVSGKKFSLYVKEEIFLPLGMLHSRFDNREQEVADVYMAFENGKVEKINEGKILLPTRCYESGGGGFVCIYRRRLYFVC